MVNTNVFFKMLGWKKESEGQMVMETLGQDERNIGCFWCSEETMKREVEVIGWRRETRNPELAISLCEEGRDKPWRAWGLGAGSKGVCHPTPPYFL